MKIVWPLEIEDPELALILVQKEWRKNDGLL